jgi:6-pyruvoyl-tetrahydropterin synthase
LVDIIVITKKFDNILEKFREKLLNTLPEFYQKSPSLENFSYILWNTFASQLNAPKISSIEVKIWENGRNWASFTGDISQ